MAKSRRNAGEPLVPRFRADERIDDMLQRDARVKDVLLEFGLPCHRCVVKDYETLAEGCVPLGLRPEDILGRLNALLVSDKTT